jgi:hypothetical protein
MYDSETTGHKLDIEAVGKAILKSATRGNSQDCKVVYSQKSLTGNMAIEELRNRKIQWKVKNESALNNTRKDLSNNTIGPQEIQVFEVRFEECSEKFLMF